MLLNMLLLLDSILQMQLFQINQSEESSKITIMSDTPCGQLHQRPITSASNYNCITLLNDKLSLPERQAGRCLIWLSYSKHCQTWLTCLDPGDLLRDDVSWPPWPAASARCPAPAAASQCQRFPAPVAGPHHQHQQPHADCHERRNLCWKWTFWRKLQIKSAHKELLSCNCARPGSSSQAAGIICPLLRTHGEGEGGGDSEAYIWHNYIGHIVTLSLICNIITVSSFRYLPGIYNYRSIASNNEINLSLSPSQFLKWCINVHNVTTKQHRKDTLRHT